ncbi:hypothetical protein QR680_011665 [Steinernema hermaphroditum]|uniref:Uncharacterized protein n=1 Tax=Steinernema hermaphroditum TaxID=289476 RepID=A0AA39I1Y3_9BILA|nr:hypothetical protein QR680_011665 [Steinernema hermaphroditum]
MASQISEHPPPPNSSSEKYSLHIYAACRPRVYYFSDGTSQRFSEVPPGQKSQLDLLRVEEGLDIVPGDYFPLDSLDRSKRYQFKRFEMESVDEETYEFFSSISTKFVEVSIVDSSLDDEDSIAFIKKMLTSKTLRKLNIVDSILAGCGGFHQAIEAFWKTHQWESFTAFFENSDACNFCMVETFGISTFLRKWAMDPRPRTKFMHVGTFYGGPDEEIQDMLEEKYSKGAEDQIAILHSSLNLVAHITYRKYKEKGGKELVFKVEEAKDPRTLTDDELQVFSKNDLIKMIREEQKNQGISMLGKA